MYPTIVFFFALIISIPSVSNLVEIHQKGVNAFVWPSLILPLVSCILWSWLFHLLH